MSPPAPWLNTNKALGADGTVGAEPGDGVTPELEPSIIEDRPAARSQTNSPGPAGVETAVDIESSTGLSYWVSARGRLSPGPLLATFPTALPTA